MKFADIPAVALELGDERKFIVAELMEPERGESKIVFRAQRDVLAHIGLVLDLQDEVQNYGYGITVTCIGGGKVVSSTQDNLISISGRSRDFGKEPNRANTVAMLQENYPDFIVTSN